MGAGGVSSHGWAGVELCVQSAFTINSSQAVGGGCTLAPAGPLGGFWIALDRFGSLWIALDRFGRIPTDPVAPGPSGSLQHQLKPHETVANV